jgi:four helix bundle protein
MEVQFDYEKLDVYQAAVEFVLLANDVTKAIPRGRAFLGDQLQRASTSVVLNIAEGAGEFSGKDKARFYRFARRSATECAAILDICDKLGFIEEDKKLAGRDILHRVVSMLTKLASKGAAEYWPGTVTGTETVTESIEDE